MSVATGQFGLKSGQRQAAPVAGGAAASTMNDRRAPTQNSNSDVDTARAVVLSVVRRIETYLDEENVALDKMTTFDFKLSNDRKSQGLVDLNQALRRLAKADVGHDLKKRLAAFRAKLDVNLKKLRIHLNAVKEISDILSSAIQDAESDGTYTRNIGPYRGAP